MISFEPSEDQALMAAEVAAFARTVLRPKIRHFEGTRAVSDDVRNAAHGLGLGMAALPEQVGGAGLGMTTAVLLEEELGWGDAGAAFALGGPGAFGFAVAELGTTEEARTALEPFTARAHTGAVAWGESKSHPEKAGFTTRAVYTDGNYTLDGEKAYVVNADRADVFVVFASVENTSQGYRGLGAFVVPKDTRGLTVLPRATTLGLDAASFGGIALKGVVVPKSARLSGASDFDAALIRFFAKHALVVAARSVGLGRAALESTIAYVDERKAFGKPIGHFQAVAFNVADRAIDVDASRALVLRAAAAWDARDANPSDAAKERDALLLTAQAVATTHEATMRCGNDAVQLYGGAGFMRDYLVEKFMRDARQLSLCTMTAEHADQLAAAVELGIPLDPACVLPTPDTQNAFV